MNFNKVILMGNLTREVDVRYSQQGTAIAGFALAVNRRYRQGDEMKDEVSYFDIIAFGKQAENCGQYLSKGDSVLIEGRLKQERWETDDGQKRSTVKVIADSVTFMPKRQSGRAHAEDQGPPQDDDIPF